MTTNWNKSNKGLTRFVQTRALATCTHSDSMIATSLVLGGGGLVLDCYKSAKKKQTSDGENDRSRQFTAISQRCQDRDPGVVSATIYASRKFHHAGHLVSSQCTRVMPGSGGGCAHSCGINIGTQLSETEPLVSTLVGIAHTTKTPTSKLPIGWHELGSAREIWRTSCRVVECHTFACSEHSIVISGT